jgi:hypothetical protein
MNDCFEYCRLRKEDKFLCLMVFNNGKISSLLD